MGVLRVDHPDILEFIHLKSDPSVLTNFNLSVGITDQFMRALEARADFPLLDPMDGRVVSKVPAQLIWSEMVGGAWASGDPGLVFLDRMNFFNPTPGEGAFESTNPCGEQPLLPYESCNLGSLNLAAYFSGGNDLIRWELFSRDIATAVRFLDNVIAANVFPIEACSKATLRTRKVGLGLMGFADLLLMAGIPYDSERARGLAETFMGFLTRQARATSAELAIDRGPFPAFDGSLWQRLGYPPLRNATVSTLAPTGTISLIAGCSSGIEPIFAPVIERSILDGRKLREVHPTVTKVLASKGFSGDLTGCTLSEQDEVLTRYLGETWSPAQDVSIEGHIFMQAAFQRHSDSAVSKTINLGSGATPEEVSRAYRLAYRLGCKGLTVFRDSSKPDQVIRRAEGAGGTCERDCPEC
jgi:ribonucleoside-diphosphate reductase alpha chain